MLHKCLILLLLPVLLFLCYYALISDYFGGLNLGTSQAFAQGCTQIPPPKKLPSPLPPGQQLIQMNIIEASTTKCSISRDFRITRKCSFCCFIYRKLSFIDFVIYKRLITTNKKSVPAYCTGYFVCHRIEKDNFFVGFIVHFPYSAR